MLSRQQFLWPRVDWQWQIFLRNLRNIGLGAFGSIVLLAVFFKFFPKAPFFSRLILSSRQSSQEGYTVQSPESSGLLLGKRGAAVTALRPAGKAEFEGEVLAVETDGEYLEPGSPVEIIESSGNRILSRRIRGV